MKGVMTQRVELMLELLVLRSGEGLLEEMEVET
jgi:hypothetical protein